MDRQNAQELQSQVQNREQLSPRSMTMPGLRHQSGNGPQSAHCPVCD
jgi:hypothetical protein